MRGHATRAKLLAAAAEAFATHGYAGASLRKIQAAAGVNSATNHYHYGSKAALYRGVVEQSLAPIMRKRIRAMNAIDPALAPKERLLAYMKAYLLPHLEAATSPQGAAYAHILARLLVEPRTPEVNEVFAELVAPTREVLLQQLARLFPFAGPERIARALGLVVSTMALAPLDSIFAMLRGEPPDRDRAALLDSVPRFAAAGLIELCGPLAEA